MATEEGEGAESAAPGKRTWPDQPRLEVNYNDLPVDISRGCAQWLQKHVDEVGQAWYQTTDDIAIQFTVAQNDLEGLADTTTILCNSQVALEEALQEIDPETSLVLM